MKLAACAKEILVWTSEGSGGGTGPLRPLGGVGFLNPIGAEGQDDKGTLFGEFLGGCNPWQLAGYQLIPPFPDESLDSIVVEALGPERAVDSGGGASTVRARGMALVPFSLFAGCA